MVSQVRFVARQTTYRKVKDLLVENPNIRSFPVVDSEEKQMLLGSISRRALIHILDAHLGEKARKEEAERRIKAAINTIDMHVKNTALGYLDAEKPVRSESDSNLHKSVALPRRTASFKLDGEPKERKTSLPPQYYSYFATMEEPAEVIPPPTKLNRFSVSKTVEQPLPKVLEPPPVHAAFIQPRKTSLPPDAPIVTRRPLRRNAFSSSPIPEEIARLSVDHGSSVTSIDSKSSYSHMSDANRQYFTLHNLTNDYHHLISNYVKQAKKYVNAMRGHRKKSDHFPHYDLTAEERLDWEEERLNSELVISEELIDPAPFQLVRRTSLFKVHSLFCMLSLNKAYVTDCGRLCGVVSVADLRRALERGASELMSPESQAPLVKGEEHRKASEEAFEDILTPTLEVMRSLLFNAANSYDYREDPIRKDPLKPALKLPSRRPTELSIFNEVADPVMPRIEALHTTLSPVEEEQRTLAERRSVLDGAEQLVEAVAYLRRKSLSVEKEKSIDKSPS